MMLATGAKLGPYEITGAIGAGGMGEVYRARDMRLDRIVAIKVLPAHLAGRAELRERFDREAKTIASLNHPHICTLYDTGHQDEIDFLVMEYLEGETLAQRLQKGALPIQQVLQYAIEISDALDKAHRKGITHRDLKPGNIMLTKSGTKLLDFGLAKLAQEAVPATPESQLPTMKSGITGEGTILGTLQYMAPEQVEAKEVDARTDIFAFGAVVYEMATGKKAFEGKTQASLIAKILETEPPPISSLQPMTPPALDRVVKKCLAKEPEKRWQAASDVADELKWIAEGGSQLANPSAIPPRGQNRRASRVAGGRCVSDSRSSIRHSSFSRGTERFAHCLLLHRSTGESELPRNIVLFWTTHGCFARWKPGCLRRYCRGETRHMGSSVGFPSGAALARNRRRRGAILVA